MCRNTSRFRPRRAFACRHTSLIPKKAKLPAPGIVALHCHGGFYVWGKNKLVEVDNEHPALTEYKQELYQGKSIATELVRRGNVVIIVDALYWGERRMLLDEDPPSYRDPERMTKAEVADFNRRSQQSEQLVARSLFTAGSHLARCAAVG